MPSRIVYLPDAFRYSDQLSDLDERDRIYGLLQRFLNDLPGNEDRISIDIDVWRRALDLFDECFSEIEDIRNEREESESPF